MIKFLNISKQNITVLGHITINANAHFITDTSQGWIFSNTKAQNGVCEVFINYISPINNKHMMEFQPLWKDYFRSELQKCSDKKLLFDHINQPILHTIINIDQKYKNIMKETVYFIQSILKKNHPEIDEIIVDTFIYNELYQLDSNNLLDKK